MTDKENKVFALTGASTRLRPDASSWAGRLERAGRLRARLTERLLLHAVTDEGSAT